MSSADRTRLDRLVPAPLHRPVRAGLSERRTVVALRTILRAAAFDQQWYEAQTGLSFAGLERACWHYLRTGRFTGHSPHPLFEPAVAWPVSFDSRDAWDPLARHLRGQAPPSGIVHPGLAPHWAEQAGGRPRWLAWVAGAAPDSAVPLLWAGDAGISWSDFRHAALEHAAQTRRRGQLRRDLRSLAAPPATARTWAPPASGAAPDVPLVSVVLATWNRGPVLRAAIGSVLAQTLDDWELIVVDDGSDDDTLLVLEGLACHDPRIRVVPLAHGGVSRARNHGLRQARGRWVAFLDSDAAWRPDYLSGIVGFAEAHDAPWAHAVLQCVEDGTVRYRGFEGTREHLLVGQHIDLNVLVARRELIDQVGGFDESLRRAVDQDLALRLSSVAPPRLAPFVGAEDRHARRLDAVESPTWDAVVALRHSVDVDAARGRPRVAGRVTVVLPVRNRPKEAAELVSELRAAAPDVEIVVVVAGTDETVARSLGVAALADANLTVLHHPADLSWAGCVDHGAARATGEYLVAWRPNCTPTPGWWPPLRAALDEAGVAVVQPLAVGTDGRISSAGATFVPPDPVPSLLLAGFPADDARALGSARVPAAYAGVLAMRTDDFWTLGGVDPLYGSALGEVDLSLRADAQGVGATALVTGAQVTTRDPRAYLFGPDLSASARLLRLQHRTAPSSAGVWSAFGFEVVGRRVESLPADPGTPVEQAAVPVVRPMVHENPRRLRWALDTAAPAGAKGLLWGDLHFANSLAASLRRLGQQVHVDAREARSGGHRDLDDVTLVLRGLDAVTPRPGGLSLMWVISHPDLVTAPECAAYAGVFAASEPWARAVSTRWGLAVEPLLQCTDPRLFTPDAAIPDSGDDVVFVGNARRSQRLSVTYALDAGLQPAVHGGGWRGVIPDERIRGEYVPNSDLPAVYASAGVVLADHWDDMRHEGFVANRVFDVLATGGRLLSDDVAGLSDLVGSAVPVFRSPHDVARLFAGRWRTRWPDREARLALAETVRTEHSFDARAATLLDAALRLPHRLD